MKQDSINEYYDLLWIYIIWLQWPVLLSEKHQTDEKHQLIQNYKNS